MLRLYASWSTQWAADTPSRPLLGQAPALCYDGKVLVDPTKKVEATQCLPCVNPRLKVHMFR
jgi:hypothetical protein